MVPIRRERRDCTVQNRKARTSLYMAEMIDVGTGGYNVGPNTMNSYYSKLKLLTQTYNKLCYCCNKFQVLYSIGKGYNLL